MVNPRPESVTPRLGLLSPHSDQRLEGIDPGSMSSIKGDEASAKNSDGSSKVEIRPIVKDVQEDRMDLDIPSDGPDGENAGVEDPDSTSSSANATVGSDEERHELLWDHRPQTPPGM